MELPTIVSQTEWQQAHAELLAKEKEATRARDALAAERRRQPMLEFSGDYGFEGPEGIVKLTDLFQGRPQLLLYHFMFPSGGTPCGGCSMFIDQVCPLPHLNARDVSFALVSRAPSGTPRRSPCTTGSPSPCVAGTGQSRPGWRGRRERTRRRARSGGAVGRPGR
jgi:predicted dithiol-disulfide oxidoreductase (DUF899 family)